MAGNIQNGDSSFWARSDPRTAYPRDDNERIDYYRLLSNFIKEEGEYLVIFDTDPCGGN